VSLFKSYLCSASYLKVEILNYTDRYEILISHQRLSACGYLVGSKRKKTVQCVAVTQ